MSKNSKSNVKILLVEYNPNCSKVLEVALKQLSKKINLLANIDIVKNAHKALKLYKSNIYDIVFIDVNMPILDSAKIVEKIKTLNKNQLMTIISTYDFSELVDKISDLELNHYLQKPFKQEDLFKIIQEYKVLNNIN